MDARSITAEQILAVPVNEPERLFPAERDAATSLYRALVKQWHPDRCSDPRALAIVQHLTALHEAVSRRHSTGSWQQPGLYSFAEANGHAHQFKFLARRNFDLGELLIGREWLLYSAGLRDSELLARGLSTIRGLRYANPEMLKHFAAQVPTDVKVIETADKTVMVMRRRPRSIRLADVLVHTGGQLPPEHVAWLLRRLTDLACFLEFNGLAHANLTPDSVFLVPETHDIGLYDPWGLATRFGEPLVALPQFAVANLPGAVLRDKVAKPLIDMDLIKALGRQMLGMQSIPAALSDRGNPLRPILTWLAAPSSSSALDEYAAWEVAVRAVYPRREFLDLNLSFEQMYTQPKYPER